MTDEKTKFNWNLSPELLQRIRAREAERKPVLRKFYPADDEVTAQITEQFAQLGRDRWPLSPKTEPVFKFPISRRLDPVFDTLMLKQPVKFSGANLTLADAARLDDLFAATCIAITALTHPLPIGHPDAPPDYVQSPKLCAAMEQCMRNEELAAINGTLTHKPFPYRVVHYTRNFNGDFVEVTS